MSLHHHISYIISLRVLLREDVLVCLLIVVQLLARVVLVVAFHPRLRRLLHRHRLVLGFSPVVVPV